MLLTSRRYVRVQNKTHLLFVFWRNLLFYNSCLYSTLKNPSYRNLDKTWKQTERFWRIYNLRNSFCKKALLLLSEALPALEQVQPLERQQLFRCLIHSFWFSSRNFHKILGHLHCALALILRAQQLWDFLLRKTPFTEIHSFLCCHV